MQQTDSLNQLEFDRLYTKLPPSISRHSLRVGVAAFLITYANGFTGFEEYGIDAQQLKTILITGGRYHDIGKTSISPTLLYKDFPYDENQILKIHEHPTYTEAILKRYADVLFEDEVTREIVVDMGHYHHEQFDGKGYPCGLPGEKIPLPSALCAVANDFDNEIWAHYKTKNVDATVELLSGRKNKEYSPQTLEMLLNAKPLLTKMYANKNKCTAFINDLLCSNRVLSV